MEFIWNTGIDITLLAQSAGKWLEPVMQTASLLGTGAFYFLLLLIFYWCIDSSAGRQLGFMLLLSNSINIFLKLIIRHPRPYWYSRKVTAFSMENSFGLPSGHAQHSVSMWGTIAVLYSSRRLRAAMAALILVIGFSRVYLGVHFFTDVLLGWVIGFALLLVVSKLFVTAGEKLKSMNLGAQLMLAVFIPLSLLGIQMVPLLINSGWVFPEAWRLNIAAAFPGSDIPDPRKISGIISVSGAALGYGTGLALINNAGGFSTDGPLKQKCLRFAAGCAVTAAIFTGLKVILPHGDSPAADVFRFIRYTLTGLWVTWGAPEMFIRLGLTERER